MSALREWLLALDLSSPAGVLLLEGPGGLFRRDVEAGSRVSSLFVAANEAATAAGVSPAGIGLVGVARGPGSFTGVRVAVMAAKALAYALGVPLVAPDTLEAAAAAAGETSDAVLVVMDARRGEVYHALYRSSGAALEVLHGPGLSPPGAVAERIPAWEEEIQGALGILGTGVEAYAGAWPRDKVLRGVELPDAAALARLCRRHHAGGAAVDPVCLLPLYIRRPDARERFTEPGGGAPCT